MVSEHYNYIANVNTGKFHKSHRCRAVGQMNEEHKWFFTGTREELLEYGYKACGICHP